MCKSCQGGTASKRKKGHGKHVRLGSVRVQKCSLVALVSFLASRFLPWVPGLTPIINATWNCKQQVKRVMGAGLLQSSLPILVVSAQHAPCSSLIQHFRLWNPAQQDRNHVYSPGWFPFEESSRFLTHLKIRLDSGMQNLFLPGYLPLLSHWWGGISYDASEPFHCVSSSEASPLLCYPFEVPLLLLLLIGFISCSI